MYITEEGEVRVRFLEDGIQRVVKAEGELIGRVVDPDPDPAFLIADPDPVLNPGFWWPKIKKITAEKIIFSKKKLQFSYP